MLIKKILNSYVESYYRNLNTKILIKILLFNLHFCKQNFDANELNILFKYDSVNR